MVVFVVGVRRDLHEGPGDAQAPDGEAERHVSLVLRDKGDEAALRLDRRVRPDQEDGHDDTGGKQGNEQSFHGSP